MMACSNGIILALLQILHNTDENSNKLEENVLIDIFFLLENLSRFSISPQEIRYTCQLFHRNSLFKKQLLEFLIKSAKHDDPDVQCTSSYFDLQQGNSGIILPTIRRWSSLSIAHHFSFHCSSLFVSISDHRELVYIELNDCNDLIDGCWHSLTIVHKAQRPSLFGSAFQTAQLCHLTIYIDGLIRKEIKDFKYISFPNDSINLASIGSPSQRPKSSVLKMKTKSLSTTIAKSIQPLKRLLSSKTKNSVFNYPLNLSYFSQF
ncbi:unnamed protein product [Rotaria socialis]|uniref:Uncharacterized protein n=1 Tax=Rotaria socialis TaxID=392032 RepID=A0A817MWD0_9BILA|nr:unnamed protein product [Rotaria socialis]